MSTIQRYIRFVVRTFEQNIQDLAPIRCRLTYSKNRKDFSTGITVNPDHWDPRKKVSFTSQKSQEYQSDDILFIR